MHSINYNILNKELKEYCPKCNKEKLEREGKFCIKSTICPECGFKKSDDFMLGGNNFVFYGETNGKKRLHCKYCGHTYTLKNKDEFFT